MTLTAFSACKTANRSNDSSEVKSSGFDSLLAGSEVIGDYDLVCLNQGGGWLFNTKTKKIWQTSFGDTEGIPLAIETWTYEGPNVTNIAANIPSASGSVYYAFQLKKHNAESWRLQIAKISDNADDDGRPLPQTDLICPIETGSGRAPSAPSDGNVGNAADGAAELGACTLQYSGPSQGCKATRCKDNVTSDVCNAEHRTEVFDRILRCGSAFSFKKGATCPWH